MATTRRRHYSRISNPETGSLILFGVIGLAVYYYFKNNSSQSFSLSSILSKFIPTTIIPGTTSSTTNVQVPNSGTQINSVVNGGSLLTLNSSGVTIPIAAGQTIPTVFAATTAPVNMNPLNNTQTVGKYQLLSAWQQDQEPGVAYQENPPLSIEEWDFYYNRIRPGSKALSSIITVPTMIDINSYLLARSQNGLGLLTGKMYRGY